MPGWLNRLRRAEVTERVDADPRSVNRTLFGMKRDDAMAAIGGGQADFDSSSDDFSSDDLALLYAYLIQKGHLEELVTAFDQLMAGSKPMNPVVVDVGCGPFTGGLALAATLGPAPCYDYVGIDRADSMRLLGQRLACSEFFPGCVTTRWAPNIDSIDWSEPRGWRDVIVIVSYLFASPTLDTEALFGGLMKLLDQIGRGRVTLLYTNSAQPGPNHKYPDFRSRLEEAEFRSCVEDQGEIVLDRWNGLRKRRLFYALFHRPRRGRLGLGG